MFSKCSGLNELNITKFKADKKIKRRRFEHRQYDKIDMPSKKYVRRV